MIKKIKQIVEQNCIIVVIISIFSILIYSAYTNLETKRLNSEYLNTIIQNEKDKTIYDMVKVSEDEEKIYSSVTKEEKEKPKIIKSKKKSKKKKHGNSKVAVIVTHYNPVKEQCNSDPLTTADLSKINLKKLRKGQIRWCAISRDLQSRYNFGDKIIIKSDNPKINGTWEIHDLMNKRYTKRVDLLMPVESDLMVYEEALIAKK